MYAIIIIYFSLKPNIPILQGQSAEIGFFVIPGDVQQYDNNIPAFINVTESAKVCLFIRNLSTVLIAYFIYIYEIIKTVN